MCTGNKNKREKLHESETGIHKVTHRYIEVYKGSGSIHRCTGKHKATWVCAAQAYVGIKTYTQGYTHMHARLHMQVAICRPYTGMEYGKLSRECKQYFHAVSHHIPRRVQSFFML